VFVLQNSDELVWQQLDKACNRSPLCAPRRLAALQEAHAQLQQQVAGLEQQLREAKQQLAQCSIGAGIGSRD
jgi:multidrug resistance efflux pump